MSFNLKTPKEIQQELAERLKARRLSQNLTQEGLSTRSGVSWGSIKRFERTGQISLDSLLKLCLVLGCLQDFENISLAESPAKTLDEILAEKTTRKKGRLK